MRLDSRLSEVILALKLNHTDMTALSIIIPVGRVSVVLCTLPANKMGLAYRYPASISDPFSFFCIKIRHISNI